MISSIPNNLQAIIRLLCLVTFQTILGYLHYGQFNIYGLHLHIVQNESLQSIYISEHFIPNCNINVLRAIVLM